MALKGYHSYRGRPGAFRWLLAVALVLILIVACTFLLLQQYVIYADDGSFYLEFPFESDWKLPFLNGKDDGEKTDPDGENGDSGDHMNLVVDRPPEDETEDPPVTDQDQDQEQETPPTAERETPRRIVELTQIPQDEAALIDILSANGADGFAFLAKTGDGTVTYASTAAIPGAVAENAVSRELIGRLCAEEEVYTVARINCFLDPIFAFANMDAAVCQSNGYVWYDYNMQHWLDPEKEAARQYVIGLAVECARMGFDELMLETMYYPADGKLYKIDYSQNTMEKTAALILFLNELETALEPYGVNISLVLEESVVRGLAENTADTGFAPQEILPLVDAVYLVTEDEEAARQEMKTLLGGEKVPALIPMVSEAAGQKNWYKLG